MDRHVDEETPPVASDNDDDFVMVTPAEHIHVVATVPFRTILCRDAASCCTTCCTECCCCICIDTYRACRRCTAAQCRDDSVRECQDARDQCDAWCIWLHAPGAREWFGCVVLFLIPALLMLWLCDFIVTHVPEPSASTIIGFIILSPILIFGCVMLTVLACNKCRDMKRGAQQYAQSVEERSIVMTVADPTPNKLMDHGVF